MIVIRLTNDKQREVLAEFYSNFALVWLTVGFVTPIFAKTYKTTLEFWGGAVFSILAAILLLWTSLKFLK